MFRSRIPSPAFLALLLLLGAPGASRAEITVTPFIGPHVTTTRLAFDFSNSATVIQVSPMTYLGGALTWRHSPRLAIEGVLGYGRGELDIVANQAAKIDAAIVNTEALVRWSLTPADADTRWELVAGAGAHRLRGTLADAYRRQAPSVVRARLSVVAGLAASWRVTQAAHLRLDVLDHMHGAGMETSVSNAGFSTSRSVQHDVSMTVGMEVPIRR